MSYDLAVFDPVAPPPNRAGFHAWFKDQVKWSEGHRYDDPKVSTPVLRNWFFDIIKIYPMLNGPYATKDIDNPKTTDYSVGKSLIYPAFAWSEQHAARSTVFSLAKKHRVGFYDVSADDGQVWLPRSNEYIHVFGSGDSSKALGQMRVYTLSGIKKIPK